MRPKERDLVAALATELASVVGALLQVSSRAVPVVEGMAPRWSASFDISGAFSGRMVAAFDDGDARMLVKRITGIDDRASDDMVVDTLLEICRQAAGSLSQLPVASGTRIAVASAATTPAGPPTVFELLPNHSFTARVACWAECAAGESSAAREPEPAAPPNLDVILDIELPLSVRFGSTEMTLKSLTRLGLGSVIDLGRSPDDPVELLINDKIVARGDVVVVAGNYGVRITEVISAADRIRSLAP